MTYRAPIEEQRFALSTAPGLPDLAEHPRFEAARPEMIDAILEGAAVFAEGEFAPLNRAGDQIGARHFKVALDRIAGVDEKALAADLPAIYPVYKA